MTNRQIIKLTENIAVMKYNHLRGEECYEFGLLIADLAKFVVAGYGLDYPLITNKLFDSYY